MIDLNSVLNTVICGDSLQLLKDFPDKCVDLVLTDPPYNVGVDYGVYVDKKSYEEYLDFSKRWFTEAKRVSPLIVFTPGWVNLKMWLTEIEYPFWVCVWYCKNTMTHSRIQGFAKWEPILVYGKISTKVPADVFEYPIFEQKHIENFPNPKNLPLWSNLLESFSKEGDLILDPFSGSGSTAIACKRLKRRFIGIELNPGYVDICNRRLSKTEIVLDEEFW